MTAKKKDPDIVDPEVLAAQQEFDRKLLAADASKRQVGRQLAAAKKQIELLQIEVGLLEGQIDELLVPPVQTPLWMADLTKKSKKELKHHAAGLFHVSDTHVGEFVSKKQMNGKNKYDTKIYRLRMKHYVERSIGFKRDHASGITTWDGATLALNGDLVSGTIHDELERTNEISAHEAIQEAHDGLQVAIDILLEEFGRVHVVSAPGNHGRHYRKVTYKNFSAENADTAVATWLAKYYRDEPNVTFNIPQTLDASFKLYGYKFSMEHGHAFKFGGSAEIGSIGPITRGTLRKHRQMAGEDDVFDYFLLGHFHQWMAMGTSSHAYQSNGSMIGYNEYARGLHLMPQPPIQGFSIITPQWGISQEIPIFCMDRKTEKW